MFRKKEIHSNDRHKSYQIQIEDKMFFTKESVLSSAHNDFHREKYAIQLFSIVEPTMLPEILFDTNNLLFLEWLDNYEWLHFCKPNPIVFKKVGFFLRENNKVNKFLSLKLKDNELASFAENKIKHIDFLIKVYQKGKIVIADEYILSLVKKTIDCFAEENQILIHGDLCSSNILVNKNSNIKIIDFEYSTFSSIEFDLARLTSSLVMCGLENFRITNEKYISATQKSILLNFLSVYREVETIIRKPLFLKYVGLHLLKIIFIHKNNFTTIENRHKYIEYFISYCLFFFETNNMNSLKCPFILELLTIIGL